MTWFKLPSLLLFTLLQTLLVGDLVQAAKLVVVHFVANAADLVLALLDAAVSYGSSKRLDYSQSSTSFKSFTSSLIKLLRLLLLVCFRFSILMQKTKRY